MRKITPSLTTIAALLLLGLNATPAQAQQARSFVSGLGSDFNAPNCTRNAPCRTFQVAHDNTLANGEVTVLDPGSYGAVTINRNISIINDGVGEAGLLVSGGNIGINVNAPGAVVTLRGLTIKGIGFGGGNGIVFDAGKALTVENCTIRNLDGVPGLGFGILFEPSAAAVLTVTNSAITDNAATGIILEPTGTASATGVLDHVGLYNNGFNGLVVNGTRSSAGSISVTVVDSVAANNGAPGSGGGFVAISDVGAAAVSVSLFRSVANHNGSNGVLAQGINATVSVGASMIQFNASGWLLTGGGAIQSYGDNEVNFNGANQGPMLPLLNKQ
jgi:hypothetical protein